MEGNKTGLELANPMLAACRVGPKFSANVAPADDDSGDTEYATAQAQCHNTSRMSYTGRRSSNERQQVLTVQYGEQPAARASMTFGFPPRMRIDMHLSRLCSKTIVIMFPNE